MKINLEEYYDMNDYIKKVESMTEPELLKERDAIAKKMKLNYTFLIAGYTHKITDNIGDNPDEKNRVYNRKKIAIISKFVSSKINKFADNMEDYWVAINKAFLYSTEAPDYAGANIKGKRVTFANRLSLFGMIAYKHYLLNIFDNLDIRDKFEDFNTLVNYSLYQEKKLDIDMDRDEFFSRKVLPEDQETITKNLLKEKILRERIKKTTGFDSQEKDEKTNK